MMNVVLSVNGTVFPFLPHYAMPVPYLGAYKFMQPQQNKCLTCETFLKSANTRSCPNTTLIQAHLSIASYPGSLGAGLEPGYEANLSTAELFSHFINPI